MIAIIPARAGSKKIPGKNIMHFDGIPLIGYTIREALKSEYITEVIVTTESQEIAEIVREFGASVPFLRPVELAEDDSEAIDVFIHTVEKLEKEFGYDIPNFLTLQPTSPLRTSSDIDKAVQIFLNKEADSVISVCEASSHPVWAKRIKDDGTLHDYFPDKASTKNRQKIEKAYMPNGAIFIFKTAKLIKEYRYNFENTFPYIMPAERSVDIDTELDFEFAEFLMKKRNDS